MILIISEQEAIKLTGDKNNLHGAIYHYIANIFNDDLSINDMWQEKGMFVFRLGEYDGEPWFEKGGESNEQKTETNDNF